uniref:Odorant-binding protein 5 n=1 Tax=Heortia vitessoides TaxID=1557813 RepID=A0A3G6V7G8_9NEOP|nr:odorant-binding protein 5 [Heortia vitessoides]
MKYLAVILAFCLAGAYAGLSDEQKAKLVEHRKVCVAQTGLDPQVVENIKRGQPVQFDEKLSCFAACMLKRIGIMRPDGSMDEQVARAKLPKDLPKDKVDAVINSCKTQVGRNQCETGGKVLGCLLKTKAVSILH